AGLGRGARDRRRRGNGRRRAHPKTAPRWSRQRHADREEHRRRQEAAELSRARRRISPRHWTPKAGLLPVDVMGGFIPPSIVPVSSLRLWTATLVPCGADAQMANKLSLP